MFTWVATAPVVLSLAAAAWVERHAAKPHSNATKAAIVFLAIMAGSMFVALLDRIGR